MKLENIVIVAQNHVKLIDFGLSKEFAAGEKLRVHCGSPSYAAPEICTWVYASLPSCLFDQC